MKLVLKRFSQEVEVGQLDQAQAFLVFEDEESAPAATYRIPVGLEAIEAMTHILSGEEAPPVPAIAEDPEDEEQEEEIDTTPPKKRLIPKTEDEVPSL